MIKRVRRWVTVSGLHRQEKGQQKAQGRRDHLFGLAIRPFHVVMLSISCYWRKKMTRQLTATHGIAGRAQGLSGVRTRRAGTQSAQVPYGKISCPVAWNPFGSFGIAGAIHPSRSKTLPQVLHWKWS